MSITFPISAKKNLQVNIQPGSLALPKDQKSLPPTIRSQIQMAKTGPSESELLEVAAQAYGHTASQIKDAAAAGKHEELQKLLGSATKDVLQALVNIPDEAGDTPLFHCARSGSLPCMELLLASGANPLHVNLRKESFLHQMAFYGQAELLKNFLEKTHHDVRKILLKARDEDGDTALFHCALSKSTNTDDTQPLDSMVSANIDCMNLLLDAGADKLWKNAEGENFVHVLTREGRPELLNVFLERVSKARSLRKDPVKTLINAPDKADDTPLFNCAISDSPECVSILLKAGVNKMRKTNERDNFLHILAREGCPDTLGTFLQVLSKEERQSLIDAPNKNGDTPLLACCMSGSIACMDLLLAKGATPSTKSYDSQNFMHKAARFDQLALLDAFIRKISKNLIQPLLDAPDINGDRPLFESCKLGSLDSIEHLLKLRPNLMLVNHKGESAYELAIIKDRQAAARLLLEKEPKLEGLLIFKILGHVFGFEPHATIAGKKIPYEGSYGFFMHKIILADLRQPRARKIFSMCKQKQFKEFLTAFSHSTIEKRSAQTLVKKIRSGKLTILCSGWDGHDITLVFREGYLVICNRGQGSGMRKGKDRTFFAHKIDLKKITKPLVRKIIEQDFSKQEGIEFFYEDLPEKLQAQEDAFCEEIYAISPKLSKTGVCAYAAGKGAVRAAVALITKNPSAARKASKAWSTNHREAVLKSFQAIPSPFTAAFHKRIVTTQSEKLKKHQARMMS